MTPVPMHDDQRAWLERLPNANGELQDRWSLSLAAPFDVERWMRVLKPHLDDPDPRVEGRARAELFDSNRMAMRVFEAYRALI